MILLDTSGLLAALNPDQREHQEAAAAIAVERPPFVLSPFVLAEVDYFLLTYGKPGSELRFLREVEDGNYQLCLFSSEDFAAAAAVVVRYQDLRVGLTGASIVVLAGRYGTNRVLTLDERHFRAMRTQAGEAFVVLPADA